MRKLDDIDLTVRLSREEEAARLERGQERLLQLRLQSAGLLGGPDLIGPPVLVIFEGWDASGKGGAIRRIVTRLDPRHYRVAQYSAPTQDELRQHWLHRFWIQLPAEGDFVIFDRSWYGRVLVERVEELATPQEWERAYGSIVGFERLLCANGMCIVKFWMHISADEQLKRFKRRRSNPLKRWKLTDEDWRNRERRDAYTAAAEEMIRRTDTPQAPWHIVAADSKRHARVVVLETVIDRMESAMRAIGIDPPQPLLHHDGS